MSFELLQPLLEASRLFVSRNFWNLDALNGSNSLGKRVWVFELNATESNWNCSRSHRARSKFLISICFVAVRTFACLSFSFIIITVVLSVENAINIRCIVYNNLQVVFDVRVWIWTPQLCLHSTTLDFARAEFYSLLLCRHITAWNWKFVFNK